MQNSWQWALVIKHSAELLHQLDAAELLVVGFSGGLDSTVLLHWLVSQAKYQDKLLAVHVHHGLSPNANHWRDHCQECCDSLQIPYQTIQVVINSDANKEEAARIARYDALSQFISPRTCLLTAHHQDDQAETILLNLLRGSGVKGLSGIAEVAPFNQGQLLRPLLTTPRAALLAYAIQHQLSWIEDESNSNVNFSRNFIRHQVLPLLQIKWPQASQNLARTSQLCRDAEANLTELTRLDCHELNIEGPLTHLSLRPLLDLSERRLMNVLRGWLQKNMVRCPNYATLKRIISEVIRAKQDSEPIVSFDAHSIKRYRDQLILIPFSGHEANAAMLSWQNFPQPLSLSNGQMLSATLSDSGMQIKANDVITLGYREGGESLIWHGQTKSLKKLMQEWHIPPWQRSQIPLVYVNGELAAVVGYAVSDRFYTECAPECYTIMRS